MKLKRLAIRKLKNIQAFTPLLVVGLLVAVGAVIYNFNARAANPGFYFTSNATAYKVGESFNVGVYENSDANCANVVQADFTYPANLLRLDSFSSTGSKFESTAPSDSTNGRASITQYTTRRECGTGASATSGVSGVQLIGTATFTVLGAGTATLNYQASSIAISAADNKTNVAPGSTGRSFTLTTVPVITPTPPPATPPAPPASTPPPPASPTTPRVSPATPTTSRPTPQPVTSAKPVASDTAVPLENNDVIELTNPVEFQPLPVQPDGINKVEYFLDTKLLATTKTAPYTFTLDQSKYLNGTYTMTTKTYYSNGQTKSVSQKVIINNKFGWSQMKLWAQKYAWLILLILLVIGAAIAAWIIHRRGSGPDNYYGDGSTDTTDDYAVSSGDYVSAQNSAYESPRPIQAVQPESSVSQPAQPYQQPRQTYAPAPTQPQPTVVGPQVFAPTDSSADPITPTIKL